MADYLVKILVESKQDIPVSPFTATPTSRFILNLSQDFFKDRIPKGAIDFEDDSGAEDEDDGGDAPTDAWGAPAGGDAWGSGGGNAAAAAAPAEEAWGATDTAASGGGW